MAAVVACDSPPFKRCTGSDLCTGSALCTFQLAVGSIIFRSKHGLKLFLSDEVILSELIMKKCR
jgi:hypothetical protein